MDDDRQRWLQGFSQREVTFHLEFRSKSEISSNNCLDSEEMEGSVAYEIGNYNALMKDCPAYQKCKTFLNFSLMSDHGSNQLELSSRRWTQLRGVPRPVQRSLHWWFPLGSVESPLRSSHSPLHLETLGCPQGRRQSRGEPWPRGGGGRGVGHVLSLFSCFCFVSQHELTGEIPRKCWPRRAVGNVRAVQGHCHWGPQDTEAWSFLWSRDFHQGLRGSAETYRAEGWQVYPRRYWLSVCWKVSQNKNLTESIKIAMHRALSSPHQRYLGIWDNYYSLVMRASQCRLLIKT